MTIEEKTKFQEIFDKYWPDYLSLRLTMMAVLEKIVDEYTAWHEKGLKEQIKNADDLLSGLYH